MDNGEKIKEAMHDRLMTMISQLDQKLNDDEKGDKL